MSIGLRKKKVVEKSWLSK